MCYYRPPARLCFSTTNLWLLGKLRLWPLDSLELIKKDSDIKERRFLHQIKHPRLDNTLRSPKDGSKTETQKPSRRQRLESVTPEDELVELGSDRYSSSRKETITEQLGITILNYDVPPQSSVKQRGDQVIPINRETVEPAWIGIVKQSA